jgi:hypothetical protein
MSENEKSEPRHVRSASDPDRPAQLAPPPAGKPSLSSDGSVRTDHAHVMTYRVHADNPDPHGVTDFDLTYGARTTAGFPLAFA